MKLQVRLQWLRCSTRLTVGWTRIGENTGVHTSSFKGQRGTQPLVGPNILEVIYTAAAGDVIDLASALVHTLCPANGCICDPFMGKGVVGDATIKFGGGRKYIGIERDRDFFLYALDVLGSNCNDRE